MEEVWLPVVDHQVPNVTTLERAVDFIRDYQQQQQQKPEDFDDDNKEVAISEGAETATTTSTSTNTTTSISPRAPSSPPPPPRVYVHCRAGHGRSAAVVFCWLLSQNPHVDRRELNRQFSQLRNVKSTLWKQPSIIEFHTRLLAKLQQTTADSLAKEEREKQGDERTASFYEQYESMDSDL